MHLGAMGTANCVILFKGCWLEQEQGRPRSRPMVLLATVPVRRRLRRTLVFAIRSRGKVKRSGLMIVLDGLAAEAAAKQLLP
jgi:hypothetical protein